MKWPTTIARSSRDCAPRWSALRPAPARSGIRCWRGANRRSWRRAWFAQPAATTCTWRCRSARRQRIDSDCTAAGWSSSIRRGKRPPRSRPCCRSSSTRWRRTTPRGSRTTLARLERSAARASQRVVESRLAPQVGLLLRMVDSTLACVPPLPQLRLLQWPRDQESLRFLAAMALQEFVLRGGFDAFGDHAQVERMRQCDDRDGDRLVVAVLFQPAHEALVDLDRLDRQAREIRQ